MCFTSAKLWLACSTATIRSLATYFRLVQRRKETIRLYECSGRGPLDWIREHNLHFAGEIDRAALANEKCKVPVDLVGGSKPWMNPAHVDVRAITNVIAVETCKPLKDEDTRKQAANGDDYPIGFDAYGHPQLPACLDRRKRRLPQAARRFCRRSIQLSDDCSPKKRREDNRARCRCRRMTQIGQSVV
jgi:hypothetical protein